MATNNAIRPRVAFHLVTNIYEPGSAIGGIETHLATLGAQLVQRGFDLLAILPDSPIFDPVEHWLAEAGLSIRRMPRLLGKPFKRLPKAMFEFAALLREWRIELLHVHRPVPTQGKWGLLAARLAGVRHVLATDHGPPDFELGPSARRINRLFDKLLDAIIVVSSYSRRCEIERLGRDATLIHSIPNGIDTTHFRPADAQIRSQVRAQFGLSDTHDVIGVLARLEPIKGVRDLLRAAAPLIATRPELRVLIAGRGSQGEALRHEAEDLGIGERVIFTGWLADPVQGLQALDLFVFPTRFEAFGLVAAEAMACGLPVISTQLGPLPEVVAQAETGFLVPPDDIAGLSAAIARLLDDRQLRLQMASQARQRVERLFSAAAMADQTAALYRHILAGSLRAVASQLRRAP